MLMVGVQLRPFPNCDAVYIIEQHIGAGSYSRVYQAKEKGTDLTIAIKSYKINTNDPSLYRRAAMEMSFLRFLEHPNIIGYKFGSLHKDRMYLGMEFAECGSLRQYISIGSPKTECWVQSIMKQLFNALAYLHDLRILHGDVKPENIVVTSINPFTIKLADFGSADIQGLESSILGSGGSFYYMAPELHLRIPTDTSTDLFSAGVVMYELLYGRMPLPTKSRSAYILNVRKRVPIMFDSPASVVISTECVQLIKGLLSYDKHQRPRTESLIHHPFLQLNVVRNTQNHYQTGCDCLFKCIDFVATKKYGEAYIEIIAAIQHLKIYSMSVSSESEVQKYMIKKIGEYTFFGEQIKERLRYGAVYDGSVNINMDTEKLRCMLISTPSMLTAYDMCLVGEMFINQNSLGIGSKKLCEGLNSLLKDLANEPETDRQKLLQKKANQWVSLLEEVKKKKDGSNHPGTSSSQE